jgi:hypothetical protein
MSDAGVPVEQIARLVGHGGTTTTEAVYRKQIRPVLIEGADAMDRIFPAADSQRSHSALRKGHPRRSQVACDLVGVAGFEPAASSSRTRFLRSSCAIAYHFDIATTGIH